MKKSTILYIVIFLALAVTSTVLVLRKTNSTISEVLTDFAIKDTASITRIHLADHYKNDIVLERKGPGFWIVNNTYKAKQSCIRVLLMTIKEVQVKSTLPLPARDNVIKDLATNGVTIDIYSGGANPKTYYVGSSTPDALGTLMLLKGSSQPFVTWVPGFDGYLTTRYIVRLQDWRSTDIYHLNPAEIKEVHVAYSEEPGKSFTLKINDNEFLAYKDASASMPVKVNNLLAKKYLSGYKAINFEVFVDFNQYKIDSISNQGPFAVINVTTTDKNYPPLKLYYCRATESSKGIGKKGEDTDRFYGIIGDRPNELLMVQKYVVGKLLAEYNDLAGGKVNMEVNK
jgi:hypothetical protein